MYRPKELLHRWVTSLGRDASSTSIQYIIRMATKFSPVCGDYYPQFEQFHAHLIQITVQVTTSQPTFLGNILLEMEAEDCSGFKQDIFNRLCGEFPELFNRSDFFDDRRPVGEDYLFPTDSIQIYLPKLDLTALLSFLDKRMKIITDRAISNHLSGCKCAIGVVRNT